MQGLGCKEDVMMLGLKWEGFELKWERKTKWGGGVVMNDGRVGMLPGRDDVGFGISERGWDWDE